MEIPCDVCNSGRQWRYAGAVLAAGDVAAHTAVEEVVGDMGLVVEGLEATRWGQEDDTVVAVDTEDVDGQPCRVVVLAELAVGGRSPSE
jgi:hypothetical protein